MATIPGRYRATLASSRQRPGAQLFGREVGRRPGRGRYEVGDADVPLQKGPLISRGEQPFRKTGQVQHFPETVARPGKVLPQGS
jgi:hypothetical protein